MGEPHFEFGSPTDPICQHLAEGLICLIVIATMLTLIFPNANLSPSSNRYVTRSLIFPPSQTGHLTCTFSVLTFHPPRTDMLPHTHFLSALTFRPPRVDTSRTLSLNVNPLPSPSSNGYVTSHAAFLNDDLSPQTRMSPPMHFLSVLTFHPPLTDT